MLIHVFCPLCKYILNEQQICKFGNSSELLNYCTARSFIALLRRLSFWLRSLISTIVQNQAEMLIVSSPLCIAGLFIGMSRAHFTCHWNADAAWWHLVIVKYSQTLWAKKQRLLCTPFTWCIYREAPIWTAVLWDSGAVTHVPSKHTADSSACLLCVAFTCTKSWWVYKVLLSWSV